MADDVCVCVCVFGSVFFRCSFFFSSRPVPKDFSAPSRSLDPLPGHEGKKKRKNKALEIESAVELSEVTAKLGKKRKKQEKKKQSLVRHRELR